jgi:membrane protease YdiL (CAAX protease family)
MAASLLVTERTRICLAATFGGSFLFMFLVAVCILTAQFNATTWPTVPWFPVPVLAVVFATAWWCDRRWDIGLQTPCRAPVLLIAAFAITSNIAAHAVWALEKSFHGTVYAAPSGPDDVSLLFSATYWVVISVALSTASEVSFRGIMQTQLSRHFGTVAAIGLVVLFNTFSHPWGTLWPRFFGVLAILFAWGWLRHIGGSLRACILTHIAAVMIGDAIFWTIGPVAFGEYSTLDRTMVLLVGIAALLVSVYLSRRITRGRKSGTPVTGETLTAP